MKHPLICTIAIAFLLSACEKPPEQSTEMDNKPESAQTTKAEAEKNNTATTDAMKPETIPAPANVAAPPADATVLPSGLAYQVLQPGTGKTHPTLEDTVVVHYTGWTTDGEMFDSSVVRGEPAAFPLNQLIKGWQVGIPLMVVGEKTRFWIPGEMAYANSNRPGAPKGMLVFDVELIAVK